MKDSATKKDNTNINPDAEICGPPVANKFSHDVDCGWITANTEVIAIWSKSGFATV